MDKNKGIIFGFFGGIASCVLFFFALESHLGAVLLLAAVAIFAIAKGANYFKLKATVSEDKGVEPDELPGAVGHSRAAADRGTGRDDRSQRKDRPLRRGRV